MQLLMPSLKITNIFGHHAGDVTLCIAIFCKLNFMELSTAEAKTQI